MGHPVDHAASLLGHACFCCAAGDKLAVRSLSPKFAQVVLDHAFVPQTWYHIVVSHSCGSALQSPVVRLYVNGTLGPSAKLRYPKVSSTGWSDCLPTSNHQQCLCAAYWIRMMPVYLGCVVCVVPRLIIVLCNGLGDLRAALTSKCTAHK